MFTKLIFINVLNFVQLFIKRKIFIIYRFNIYFRNKTFILNTFIVLTHSKYMYSFISHLV